MHPQDDNGGKGSGSELEFGPDTARLDALLGELKEADPPPPGLVPERNGDDRIR